MGRASAWLMASPVMSAYGFGWCDKVRQTAILLTSHLTRYRLCGLAERGVSFRWCLLVVFHKPYGSRLAWLSLRDDDMVRASSTPEC